MHQPTRPDRPRRPTESARQTPHVLNEFLLCFGLRARSGDLTQLIIVIADGDPDQRGTARHDNSALLSRVALQTVLMV